MKQKNLPIAYDYHGDIPFNVPFSNIQPQDIHVYLDLDTKIGKQTCGQACNHCWFVNYEKVHDKSFDLLEGQEIKKSLDKIGYKVFARYTDSFGYNGNFMRIYGPAHNREFRQENDHKPTDTMKKGDAWTSGRPLLGNNYKELLDLSRSSGYGTISMTFHGLINENLEIEDIKNYPIRGVFSGSNLVEVVKRIDSYNSELNERKDALRVNIGITIGRHNNSRQSLMRYVQFFNKLGVATVRFNRFTDHGGRHPHLQMNDEEERTVYRDFKWIHDNMDMKFQMALSEDFGTNGVEVMDFPKHVGWCRAGRQLFTVIPSQQSVLRKIDSKQFEKIGDVVACVNIFEPYLGALVRIVEDNKITYSIEFDHAAIEKFNTKRMNGTYKNGCFARELLNEKQVELTRQARASITKRFEPAIAPTA